LKNIKISDGVGTCEISCANNITETNEFIIKGLAGIQLLCLNRNDEKDPKVKELIEILTHSMSQITDLYSEVNNESDAFSEYS
jgi:hypothetical protein